MAEADPNNPGYDTDGEPLVKGVITATGVAAGAHASGDWNRAARVQEAMTKAVEQAQAEGVTDHEEIIKRILAARDATA